MRFEFPQFFPLQHSEAGDAVGLAALHEGLQAGDLGVAGGDDDFSGDLAGKIVFAAEGHHGGCAFDAHFGFQGAGFVVNPGVDYAAVVAALVPGDAGFFFQQQQPNPGQVASEMHCGGEADDATADDDDVEVVIGHSGNRRRLGGEMSRGEWRA